MLGSSGPGIEELSVLDEGRRASGEWSDDADVVREWSADRSECRIVAVSLHVADLAAVIEREARLADTGGYELEWKTYAHDEWAGIEDHLARFGFEPDPVEAVLVRTDLSASQST
ncbi:hypothetical protein [Williamsia sp. CHRR-6]|uniref:hypothetical protein n=1 Tax=Williamsia sp. CHRR-6 TaxID=2835871 RepID=UPI001BD9CADA|nr:hypothetical protein [Williamsia sp. CHRR-6]MBT0565399.1 hypothetical protein [Williamsia sp. CHRR-6]